MGKKKLDVMAKEREVFINGQVNEDGTIEVPGCVRNGVDAKSADKIFDEMVEFAKYAFNKSHAACYAVVAYQTAFLKTYYPAEFIAATLNSYLGNLDKVPQYIAECKTLGIEILKPDINSSFTDFTVENGKIRFGLGSIKNVGTTPIETIVRERNENGNYASFTDFCERIAGESVNKKCIESLIKAGAFDEFSQTRSTLLASFEIIVDSIQSENRKGLDGQVSMFDLGGDDSENELKKIKYKFEEKEEFQEKELLAIEKEMVGIYISGHPLDKIKEQIKSVTNFNTLDLQEMSENLVENQDIKEVRFIDGQIVKYAGIITSVKKKYTKNNKIMAFITVEDLYGQIEVLVFENVYMRASNFLENDNIVLIEGKLSMREDETPSIVARSINKFEIDKRKELIFDINGLEESVKSKLRTAIRSFQGKDIPINVEINNEKKPCGEISWNNNSKKIFEEILGKDRIKFE